MLKKKIEKEFIIYINLYTKCDVSPYGRIGFEIMILIRCLWEGYAHCNFF